MSGKRFVVSGGNGYIGSHMCHLLSQQGHEVFIFDNFATSSSQYRHPYGRYYEVDIGDGARVSPLLRELGPIDAVFHFASRIQVEESNQKPLFYYQENVVKSLNFIAAVVENGISDFVFSSTCATYGYPQTEKLAEDHPQNPINTYGNTKKIVELYLRDLAAKGLLSALVLRYFNVAGMNWRGAGLAERHEPETHLIPNLCRAYQAQQRGEATLFSIYGQDYPTVDGTCVRDYIHVEDLVAAHYRAWQQLKRQPGFLDYNLGSERGYSVLQVLETFEAIVGGKIERRVCERREGDPPFLVGNSAKIQQQLGFKFERNLYLCVQDCWEYYNSCRENEGGVA